MTTRTRAWGIIWLIASTLPATAQVQNNGAGDYRLNPTNPNTVPQGPKTFTVGNAYVAGQSLLNVRGDLLTGTNQTPEVFLTNAPATANTYWRMFQGGTTAGFERGQLFAEPANSNFNLNAPNGNYLMHTQNVARARLSGNVTSAMGPTNPFPVVNRDGFFLLSGQPDAFTNAASRAPFSRLHLVDDIGAVAPLVYAQEHGFRPWQRNGITFTGNSDQGYIGQQFNGADATDIVIHWSDNPDPSPNGTDRLKFIFTSDNQNTAFGSRSFEGLEFMRMFPVNAMQGWIGQIIDKQHRTTDVCLHSTDGFAGS